MLWASPTRMVGKRPAEDIQPQPVNVGDDTKRSILDIGEGQRITLRLEPVEQLLDLLRIFLSCRFPSHHELPIVRELPHQTSPPVTDVFAHSKLDQLPEALFQALGPVPFPDVHDCRVFYPAGSEHVRRSGRILCLESAANALL